MRMPTINFPRMAVGRGHGPGRSSSGMSFEDFRADDLARKSNGFDAWLRRSVTAPPSDREAALVGWENAAFARDAHPHAEHLLPLIVVAGAAGNDAGRIGWSGSRMGIRVSAVHFGDLPPAQSGSH